MQTRFWTDECFHDNLAAAFNLSLAKLFDSQNVVLSVTFAHRGAVSYCRSLCFSVASALNLSQLKTVSGISVCSCIIFEL